MRAASFRSIGAKLVAQLRKLNLDNCANLANFRMWPWVVRLGPCEWCPSIGVPPRRKRETEVHLGGGSSLRLNPYPLLLVRGGGPEPGGGTTFSVIFSGGRARRRRENFEILSGEKAGSL